MDISLQCIPVQTSPDSQVWKSPYSPIEKTAQTSMVRLRIKFPDRNCQVNVHLTQEISKKKQVERCRSIALHQIWRPLLQTRKALSRKMAQPSASLNFKVNFNLIQQLMDERRKHQASQICTQKRKKMGQDSKKIWCEEKLVYG